MKKYISPKEINELPSKPADAIYNYGKHKNQFLEVRRPKENKNTSLKQCIVIIHGGCWKSYYATCKNTAALADALRDNGYLTINLEYRAVDHEGGGWPGTFKDINNGINFLQQIADKENIDLNHVIAIGHSAGGHLAMWALARHILAPSSPLFQAPDVDLQGAISLGGASDLESHFHHFNNICGDDTLTSLFDGSPLEVPENYRQGTASGLLPIAKAQVYITGEDDTAVLPIFAKQFLQLAQERGDEKHVEVFTAKSVGHHEYNDPRNRVFSLILKCIEKMLKVPHK